MLPKGFEDPFHEGDIVVGKSKKFLSGTMQEAGLHRETDYSLIAREMKPDEIHPEVKEKLDILARELGVESAT